MADDPSCESPDVPLKAVLAICTALDVVIAAVGVAELGAELGKDVVVLVPPPPPPQATSNTVEEVSAAARVKRKIRSMLSPRRYWVVSSVNRKNLSEGTPTAKPPKLMRIR